MLSLRKITRYYSHWAKCYLIWTWFFNNKYPICDSRNVSSVWCCRQSLVLSPVYCIVVTTYYFVIIKSLVTLLSSVLCSIINYHFSKLCHKLFMNFIKKKSLVIRLLDERCSRYCHELRLNSNFWSVQFNQGFVPSLNLLIIFASIVCFDHAFLLYIMYDVKETWFF